SDYPLLDLCGGRAGLESGVGERQADARQRFGQFGVLVSGFEAERVADHRWNERLPAWTARVATAYPKQVLWRLGRVPSVVRSRLKLYLVLQLRGQRLLDF